jgi:hypothetical protein
MLLRTHILHTSPSKTIPSRESGQVTTYKDMSILIENMRGVCTTMKRVPDIWTNAFWKKLATGSSGLKKHQIQHFVQHKVKGTELLGSRASDTHVWDAAGIAYAKFLQLQGEQ